MCFNYDMFVLMVWFGLGPETTWLGFGKDHTLAQSTVPVLVATNMSRFLWKKQKELSFGLKLMMLFSTISGILNILGVC